MNGPEIDAEMRVLMEETSAMIDRGQIVPDRIELWWEERRENELTPDYLGRVLDEAGLPGMARNARAAHYDDFHAPAEVADGLEILRLVRDLRRAARAEPEKADRIAVIENATRRGEFDATKAESDRWAASEDGQDTFGELLAPMAMRSAPKWDATTRAHAGRAPNTSDAAERDEVRFDRHGG